MITSHFHQLVLRPIGFESNSIDVFKKKSGIWDLRPMAVNVLTKQPGLKSLSSTTVIIAKSGQACEIGIEPLSTDKNPVKNNVSTMITSRGSWDDHSTMMKMLRKWPDPWDSPSTILTVFKNGQVYVLHIQDSSTLNMVKWDSSFNEINIVQ